MPNKMRNIKLTLEYDGTNYHGFQSQKNAKAIQDILEAALSDVLGKKTKVISSSRTDSKVHALCHTANFKTASELPLTAMKVKLNEVLPKGIVVKDMWGAHLGFHSQFDAKSKVYRYTILNRDCRSPLYDKYSHLVKYKLNINLMRREARCLVGRHDFKAFQASAAKEGPTVRSVKAVNIKKDGHFIYITIEADGFLYNMVRKIVGTLIEIGRGRFKPGSARMILCSKGKRLSGPTVPARGLCLIDVKY